MQNRQGCLQGLLELFLLDKVFKWAEGRFGFGRGWSCAGCVLGVIFLIVFVVVACSILGGTNWFKLY